MKAMSITWALAAGALMVVACTSRYDARSSQSSRPVPQPPASVAMDPSSALGLWQSNFGAVKIERDDSAAADTVMGVWVYDRSGNEVIGFFTGELRGNVLEFTWHEPAEPQPLTGAGYLAFEPQGSRFSGRWWTHDRSREGLWSGWRHDSAEPVNPSYGSGDTGGAYGGNTYGGDTYGGDTYGQP
jgi:hypothetical protein